MRRKTIKSTAVYLLAAFLCVFFTYVYISLGWSSYENLKTSIYYKINRSRIEENRRHVFCEVLNSSMDEELVEKKLLEVGELEQSDLITTTLISGFRTERYIVFNDPLLVGYAKIKLIFMDHKYQGASIKKSLDIEEFLCDSQ